MNGRNVVWGCVLASLLGGAGCAFDAGSANGDGSGSSEDVGEVKNAIQFVACGAIYQACYDQLDATGSVWVRYYMCKATSANHANVAACPVEADRVLVGGGATIENGNSNGAPLWLTYPSGKANGSWVAASKEVQGFPDVHQLRTWAVGLKLSGFSAAQLASAIHVTTTSSAGNVSTPGAVAIMPAGEVLLGGGALTSTAGPGQFLTGVVPTAAGWVGKAKEHILASPGSITVIGYSMPSCPAGLGYCVQSSTNRTSANVGSGWWGTETAAVPAGSALIAAGGDAFYNGAGRLLTHLYPNLGNQTGYMAAKDIGFADTGSNSAAAVSLRRVP